MSRASLAAVVRGDTAECALAATDLAFKKRRFTLDCMAVFTERRWLSIFGAALFSLLVALPHPANVYSTTDTLDMSWEWLLAHSWNHLEFGRSIFFTYGPYGFLEHPFYGVSRPILFSTVIFAFLVTTALVWVTGLVLLKSKLWQVSSWRGKAASIGVVGLTLIVATTSSVGMSFQVAALCLVLVVAATLTDPSGRHSSATVAMVSTLTAIGFLMKLNLLALFASALVAIVVIEVGKQPSESRRRAWGRLSALSAGLTVAIALSLWCIAGDDPLDAPRFFVTSLQFFVGYDAGLALQGPGIHVACILGSLLVICGLLVIPGVVALRGAQSTERVQKICVLFCVVVWTFIFWKEGFVRQDQPIGHQLATYVALSFAALVLLLAGFTPSKRQLGLFASAAVLFVAVWELPSPLAPITHLRGISSISSLARTAVKSTTYQRATEKSLEVLRSHYSLPDSFVAAIGSDQVAVLPWDLTMGPAYGLNEVELPIAQLYVANTPVLDGRDAATLLSNGPKWVIYSLEPFDNHYPLWTAPSTLNVLFGQYQLVQSDRHYALLLHDPAAVEEKSEGTVTAHFNQSVVTPSCASGTLTAALRFTLSAKGRVNHALNHVEPPKMGLRTTAGQAGPFRLIWSDTQDGLMMSNLVGQISQIPRFGIPSSSSPLIQAFTIAGSSDFVDHFTVDFVCHRALLTQP